MVGIASDPAPVRMVAENIVKESSMKYAVIANGEFNNAVWYGTFDDLDTAKTVAEKVNGKVVIWEF